MFIHVIVHELGARRRQLLPPKKIHLVHTVFDPHPLSLRSPDPAALEQMRCKLLKISIVHITNDIYSTHYEWYILYTL